MPRRRLRVHPVKPILVSRGMTHRDLGLATRYGTQTITGVLNYRIAAWPELRRRVAEALGESEAVLFPEVADGGPEDAA